MHRFIGRVLGIAGLLTAVPYLVWRVVGSLDGTAAWLSVPALLVEVVGLAASALLIWALWPTPTAAGTPRAAGSVGSVADVVVRVDRQADHEVLATLVGLLGVHARGQVIVVDRSGRPTVAAMAARHGAALVPCDAVDPGCLAAASALVRTPRFLLLDAGDVPSPGIVTTLSPHLGARVAIVQGRGASFAVDSAEHGHDHLHEAAFEWSGLNPALGARGAAMWTGSGSIVRTEAVRGMSVGHESAIMTHAVLGAALQASGWEIVAPDTTPVVAHRRVRDQVTADRERTDRIRAAAAVVFGRVGALRAAGMPWRRRAALVAWAVKPLSPFRRLAFVAVVVASLLAGQVPLQASGHELLVLWLPTYATLTVSLSLLSRRTLRLGDRVRWSLQAVGSAVAAVRPRRIDRPVPGPSVVVAVLTAVLVLRALSERFVGGLPRLDTEPLTVLVLTVLWLLALTLEVMRILARRSTERRVARFGAALSAALDDRPVQVVDLTALGAGVVHHRALTPGATVVLETTLPTSTGITTANLPCIVRNCSRTRDGEWRIGLEFLEVDPAAADALAEFCSVEPMWERLGALRPVESTGPRVFVDGQAESARPAGARSGLVVRALALLALVGAAATSGTVEAVDETLQSVEGIVVLDTDVPVDEQVATDIGVSGVLVVTVCSLSPGEDQQWGTSDDIYDQPSLTETNAFGEYQLAVTGEACWATADPVLGETGAMEFVPLAMVADADTGGVLTVSAPPVVEADRGVALVAAQQVVEALGTAPRAAEPPATATEITVAAPTADGPSSAGPARALPTPAPELLAGPAPSPLLARLVLLVTAMLALGVVAGTLRRQSVSPKF